MGMVLSDTVVLTILYPTRISKYIFQRHDDCTQSHAGIVI